MRDFEVGDFVEDKGIGELGLVGEVLGEYIRCWWHRGGTKAIIRKDRVRKVSEQYVKNNMFSNEQVKESLIERKRRLGTGEDVSDLIDIR